ncbi:hypothetical protein Asp14428_62030 [Actinoplanes sp. NBRC 14428]|nr:hypothetical protein Asp14428_62030 [Actinoplanes sp. NBRC 14428]
MVKLPYAKKWPVIKHPAVPPRWECGTCSQPWPCPEAKEELAVEYAQFPSSLTIYMSSFLPEAARDLANSTGMPPPDLWLRFLGWIRPGELTDEPSPDSPGTAALPPQPQAPEPPADAPRTAAELPQQHTPRTPAEPATLSPQPPRPELPADAPPTAAKPPQQHTPRTPATATPATGSPPPAPPADAPPTAAKPPQQHTPRTPAEATEPATNTDRPHAPDTPDTPAEAMESAADTDRPHALEKPAEATESAAFSDSSCGSEASADEAGTTGRSPTRAPGSVVVPEQSGNRSQGQNDDGDAREAELWAEDPDSPG